jgi:hypothetical protein
MAADPSSIHSATGMSEARRPGAKVSPALKLAQRDTAEPGAWRVNG